jgi:hypothetical protein
VLFVLAAHTQLTGGYMLNPHMIISDIEQDIKDYYGLKPFAAQDIQELCKRIILRASSILAEADDSEMRKYAQMVHVSMPPF